MTDHKDDYESYVHHHELVPKWANLVARVLNQKPTDSTATKVARFGGLVTSPIWAAAPTLAAHVHDEFMYGAEPFFGMPGYLQYKTSRAMFGPKPASLPSPSNFKLPPRPVSYTTIPKVQAPALRRIDVRPPPRYQAPPPRPSPVIAPRVQFASNLHVADPSWKLRLSTPYKPPPSLSTRMTLTPPHLGASLPFRPFAPRIGFAPQQLTLRKF